jgi:hypothetical protein
LPRRSRTGKSSGSKSGADEGPATPIFDILDGLDPETLALVRDKLRAQLESGDDEYGPVALFDEFLRRVEALAIQAHDESDDFFNEVVAMLSQLAIDDNGGDPEARETRSRIFEKLEAAVYGGRLDAASLMLVGKVLSDSGWDVPDSLKGQLVRLLEASGTSVLAAGLTDLKASLAEIVDASDGDAFAAYEALNSVLAAFPSEVAAKMLATLGEGQAPVLLHVLAGFAMHREPRLAHAAIDELKRAANPELVESALVERLVRMRPWLPTDRQGPLDEAIRALRVYAQPPVRAERPGAIKCYVMSCDGSGAAGALATLKARDGWRFVAAMTKPAGVEEVLSLEGLGKRQVDLTLHGMRQSVIAAQTDLAGVARYLELALGENVVAKKPPPFRLIAFVENLGLGPLAPRIVSPSDLMMEVLAEWQDAMKNAEAITRAHKIVTDVAQDQPWFEAGEGVESLLAPVRGAKARAEAVLSEFLPKRREFWARACARTAFALQLERGVHGELACSLALVGREIAGGAPLANIPLMLKIAEVTVAAYESRGQS